MNEFIDIFENHPNLFCSLHYSALNRRFKIEFYDYYVGSMYSKTISLKNFNKSTLEEILEKAEKSIYSSNVKRRLRRNGGCKTV